MSVYALIMGRAGSVSVPHKNIRMVAGRHLVEWPIRAACRAATVERVYVTTDCEVTKCIAQGYKATAIDRPEHLAQADSEMSDGIVHAVGEMDPAPEILVTMHANCGIHREGLVDECVTRLIEDETLDSCVSVRFVEDCHPYRVKRVRSSGTLEPWVEIPDTVANNRQAIKDRAVVLDGAARAFRPSRCLPPNGQPPFRYLGNRIGYAENPMGRDVHDALDLWATERWVRDNL